MTTAAAVDHAPARIAAGLALLAAAGAVGVVARGPMQLTALGIELAGVVAIVAGASIRRRGAEATGAGVAIAGAAVVVAALGIGATRPERFTEQAELLPGMIGVALLGAGIAPVRVGWTRRLVLLGSMALVAGAVTSGVVYGATTAPLLAAFVLAVAAWDAGEQAANLGEQVGRRARTATVAVAHSAWTALVGGAAVGIALAIDAANVSGAPIAGLALLLGAALALATALYA